ncbi:MAG: hypothetical protein J1D88_10110 [Treponema sp.]|nr:hypothetical protein [Treponema sp.]
MKAFAKVAALLGCAMLVAGALAACDQELRDKDDRLSTTQGGQGGGATPFLVGTFTPSWTSTPTFYLMQHVGTISVTDSEDVDTDKTYTGTGWWTGQVNTSSLTLENGKSITWNVTVTSDDYGLALEGVVDETYYADLNLNDAAGAWGEGTTWNITSSDDTAYGKKGHTYEIKVSANAAGTVYTVSVTDKGSTGSTTTPGSGGGNNGGGDAAGGDTPPVDKPTPNPGDDETTDNTITGSGSVLEPFVLTNEALSETVGGQAGAFDCNKNQSTTTWDAKAKLCWDNPLYGKTGLDGVTISFMLNNKDGLVYDSVLTFFPAGVTGWGGVAFAENGSAHAQGHGFWDIWLTSDGTEAATNKIPAETWTRVTYVITKTNVTAYIGSEKFKEITLTNVDTINYLTTTCDKVAVGVGFCSECWPAGYVNLHTYLADIRVYTTALLTEQVAEIK